MSVNFFYAFTAFPKTLCKLSKLIATTIRYSTLSEAPAGEMLYVQYEAQAR